MEDLRRALRSTSGSTWPLVLLLAGLACFKPNIVDGGFLCNLDVGADKACPEGFQCHPITKRCVRSLDGGADSSDVTDAPPDVMETGPDVICYEPKPSCTPTPGGGMCDPYCQTGCMGCRERCSVNTAGTLTCNQLASGQVRGLMQPCQVQGAGTAGQIDQCAPGLVCLEDSCGGGGGGGRCYQFCRSNAECTNAPCNRDVAGGFTVCDVPYDECVPLPASGNTGCTGAAIMCYLSTSDPSRTICDCQFPPGLGEGDVCTFSRQCNPGLVCVDPNGQGTTLCTRVCRLAGPQSDCTIGNCRTYMENGVENPTYGFCR